MIVTSLRYLGRLRCAANFYRNWRSNDHIPLCTEQLHLRGSANRFWTACALWTRANHPPICNAKAYWRGAVDCARSAETRWLRSITMCLGRRSGETVRETTLVCAHPVTNSNRFPVTQPNTRRGREPLHVAIQRGDLERFR